MASNAALPANGREANPTQTTRPLQVQEPPNPLEFQANERIQVAAAARCLSAS